MYHNLISALCTVYLFDSLLMFHMFFLYFRDSNTLFRGNSVATKSVDEFMKHAGLYYLHDTIKCLVDEVMNLKAKKCLF